MAEESVIKDTMMENDGLRSPPHPPSRSPMSPERRRFDDDDDDDRYARRRRDDDEPMRGAGGEMKGQTNPNPSNILGVFGLHPETRESDLEKLFKVYGTLQECRLIMDKQTGNSRGFAFLTFAEVADAEAALKATSGMEIMGRNIRVDFSRTHGAHDPTPGKYMGRRPLNRYPPSYDDRRRRGYSPDRRRDYGGGRGGGGDRRDYGSRYERDDYYRRPRDDRYPPYAASDRYDRYDRPPVPVDRYERDRYYEGPPVPMGPPPSSVPRPPPSSYDRYDRYESRGGPPSRYAGEPSMPPYGRSAPPPPPPPPSASSYDEGFRAPASAPRSPNRYR